MAEVDDPRSQTADGAAPTLLVLVRHALTEETGPILTGRRPGIALSEEGRRQAEEVGRWLAGLPVSAVYASPIERALQTASAIASPHGLEVELLEGMMEADYGEWAGRRLDELAATDLWRRVQVAPSWARFPQGESLREMQARAVQALEGLVEAQRGRLVVVVSHADVIKAAVAHFIGLHLDLFQRLVISPASVTAVGVGATGPVLLKLNATGGLDELRPAAKEAVHAGE
ncbi:MAG: MSMEG_4193 family putative phosphomutase [Actinomycetota bacterium]|nr:MSMEG_4193 family putative phosphomutase [Actinomycetota bacterium]